MINYGHGVALCPLSDVPSHQMRDWRNNPSIYKWCRQHTPLETWEHEGWLASLPSKKDIKMFGIRALGDETGGLVKQIHIVGVCGLTSIDLVNGHAEFSLYVDPLNQGMGFGKAALRTLTEYGFDVLRLNHIFGETYEGNQAAKMFESVGYKKEGSRRKFYFREGEYIDAHLYSILASEF